MKGKLLLLFVLLILSGCMVFEHNERRPYDCSTTLWFGFNEFGGDILDSNELKLGEWYKIKSVNYNIRLFIEDCRGMSQFQLMRRHDTLLSGRFLSSKELDSIEVHNYGLEETNGMRVSYEPCYFPVKHGVWRYYGDGEAIKIEQWNKGVLKFRTLTER